ncbi:putative lipoprotein [Escherichia coli]|nr:putative lipoprotein [Escherichia coli]
MKKRHLLSLLALGISTACYGETYPAPIGPSQSDFGGVGLLQTPTARMAREGELSLNYRDNDQYRYYSASVQLFPWLETTLRYTDVRTRQYSSVEAFSGDQTYKDKAFDLKLRLWEESYWLPQVAVGARDIGGTGLFDAEYLVASKAWGPFDFTLGLGWGYLGTSGNVKIRSVQPVINIAIAITATNRRDLSTVARCSTVLPHCLAAWNTRRPGNRCA